MNTSVAGSCGSAFMAIDRARGGEYVLICLRREVFNTEEDEEEILTYRDKQSSSKQTFPGVFWVVLVALIKKQRPQVSRRHKLATGELPLHSKIYVRKREVKGVRRDVTLSRSSSDSPGIKVLLFLGGGSLYRS